MAGNWMQWLQGMNTGAPGGPMPPMGGAGPRPPMDPQAAPMFGQGPGPQPMPGDAQAAPMMPGAGGPPPMGGPPPGGPPPGGGGPLQPVGQMGPGPALARPTGRLPGAGLSDADRAQGDLYTTLMGMQPQEAKIKRARAMADQLRAGGKMPQQRDPTVASHPLEFLSSLAHTGLGAWKGAQADKEEDEYGKTRRAELEAYKIRQGL